MPLRLALHFLGSPQLYLDHEPVTVDRRKAVAFLVYLAVEGGKHTRDSLSALLWPDYDQSKAFTNLHHTLWEVQQVIGEGWIIADRKTIGLHEEADVSLDVREFESLLAQSQAHAPLIGWADLMRERIQHTRPDIEQANVDKMIAACMARMGEAAFSDAYDQGQAMMLDEAIRFAVGNEKTND